MPSTLEFYPQQLEKNGASLPGAASQNISASRQKAMQYFLQQGWPTRKQEAWKYTATTLLQQNDFCLAQENFLNIESDAVIQIQNLADVADQMFVVHESDSALVLLNHALWQQALLIDIAAHKQPQLLRIHLKKIAPNQSQFIKLFFNLAPNAEAVIILDHADAAGFSNVMIHTTLGSRAKLTFLNHCHSQQQPICFVHHEVEQHAASEYNDCSLSLKAQWLRYELNVHLQESHARCDLTGLYFGVQQEFVDHHLCVHHHAPHCQSVQFYKGVLNDEAKAVFNGKVVVAAGAQKTHAKQKNNNILLSKTAEINTKPELEIDADDVICSHGATVGALSEEALFYLLARGIAPAQAEEILITAFINEVVSKLGVIKEEVERLLKPRLKKDSLGTERVKI